MLLGGFFFFFCLVEFSIFMYVSLQKDEKNLIRNPFQKREKKEKENLPNVRHNDSALRDMIPHDHIVGRRGVRHAHRRHGVPAPGLGDDGVDVREVRPVAERREPVGPHDPVDLLARPALHFGE